MHRLYLNPLLRYPSAHAKKNGVKPAIFVQTSLIEEIVPAQCDAEQPFTAEEENWLTEATMPQDTKNAIIEGDSAYLIYREMAPATAGGPVQREPLDTAEIVRLESTGNYCYVHLVNGNRYLLAMPLKWVAKYMQDFVRIHRTHAVNPLYVKQYLIDKNKAEKSADRFLLLRNDLQLPWSRRHLREKRNSSPTLFNLATYSD